MSFSFPTWFNYLIIGPILVAFLVFLGFLLEWAWEKFFKYLGRNEIRNLDDDDDVLT